MESGELTRIKRLVNARMQTVLQHLAQQDGRPISARTLQLLRNYGLDCYLEGAQDPQLRPTQPAPPRTSDSR